MSPTLVNAVLLGLTSLAVVTLAQVVGLVMVITLLALPAATVAPFCSQDWGDDTGGDLAGLLFDYGATDPSLWDNSERRKPRS